MMQKTASGLLALVASLGLITAIVLGLIALAKGVL